MSDDDKDEEIFKVETVPPPAGESDAYNAPTKVGPMAAAVVEEMLHASVRKAAELTQRSQDAKAAAEGKGAAPAPASDGSKPPLAPPRPAATSPTSPKAAAAPVARAPTASNPQPKSAPSLPAPTSPKPSNAPPSPSKKPPRIESGYSLAEQELIQDAVPAATSSSLAPGAPGAPSAPATPPPKLYANDEADEGDNAETLVHTAAKAPPFVPPPRPPLPFIASPYAPSAPPAPVVSPPPNLLAPQPADERAERLSVYLRLIVGFAIFAVGVTLYYWAR
jgi:hypothetical protein